MTDLITLGCRACKLGERRTHALDIRRRDGTTGTYEVSIFSDIPTNVPVVLGEREMIALRDVLLKEFPLKAIVGEFEEEQRPYIMMTREEMLSRLDGGEDPLELSIEKWQRILHRVEARMSVPTSLMGSETCALCEHYWKRKGTAGSCPYRRAYSDHCVEFEDVLEARDAYYEHFDQELRPAFLDAVHTMLRRLEGLRPEAGKNFNELCDAMACCSLARLDSCGCSIHTEHHPGKLLFDRCSLHANAEKLVNLVQRAMSLIGGLNYWLIRVYQAIGSEPELQDTVTDWLKDAGKVIDKVKGE